MTGAAEVAEVDDLAFDVPLKSVPLVAAAAVVAVVVGVGFGRPLVALIPWAVVLAVITVIDLRELRVPNRIIGPALAVSIPLLALAATTEATGVSFGRALAGGGAMFGLYLVLHLLSPAGMGMGDVKLAPYIGAHLALLGWPTFMRGLLLAFVVMGLASIVLIALRRGGKNTAVAFAPFMAAGALISVALSTI